MAKHEYPPGLPRRHRKKWNNPHTKAARNSIGFRRWLAKNGYLTPNFTLAEAACKDAARTPIPRRMRKRARDHAFRLERLRHALGDVPMPITSWYRTPEHNRAVGGASQSQHMNAIATDHPQEWIDRVGRAEVQRIAEVIWDDGGIGTYPGGAMHFDSRGYRARWTTW